MPMIIYGVLLVMHKVDRNLFHKEPYYLISSTFAPSGPSSFNYLTYIIHSEHKARAHYRVLAGLSTR